jgi:hypothetical protein
VDVYPSLTYGDVEAALEWLETAFGPEPLIFDEAGAERVRFAAVGRGRGMVMVQPELPEDLHCEHAGRDLDAGVRAFSCGSERWGAREWTVEHVPAPAVHRLYRATASEYSVLDSVGHPRPGDRRIPVNLDDPRLRGDLLGGTLPARRELLPGRSRAGQRLG